MCGIAGFVQPEGLADRRTLERMTRTLTHRGPDGEGFLIDGSTALGHRRLSIIDVAGGAQPLCNEDRTIWVTYNGEIYNEFDLRNQMLNLGHVYKTRCDTESIVHLYEEYDLDFLSRLNGMFALAIWDSKRRRLVLARDRMGQKPLFYAEPAAGTLVFGSEPKAVLEHPRIVKGVDPDSLARYLFYEYVPAPHSIWAGLKKLPAAHFLTFEEGRSELGRYWSPTVPSSRDAPAFAEAAERFWSEFRASVARHRRSDVELGVFLSGGIDSSSVAAALREVEPSKPIHTFSMGFDDPSFDESGHAESVARRLGTDHHRAIFSVEAALEVLPEVTAGLDEPFGDASILPTHLLCRFARERVKVVLGGDGADELLAGYPTFSIERASAIFNRLPARARILAGKAVEALPVDHRNFSLDFKLKQFLRGAGVALPLAHQRWLCSYTGREIADLLVGRPSIDVEDEHLDRAARLGVGGDPLTRSLHLYQDTYLSEDILAKVDRAGMAHGLEVRAPFLDADLVDSVSCLPSRYKSEGGRTKRLLKRAAAGRLPSTVVRRGKKGFGMPVARWLRGPLSSLLKDHLGREHLVRQGLFRADEVARLIGEHQAGTKDHRKPLWTLLMFQLWYRRWLS